MGIKRMRAIVHGRVQGVFFRDYTRRQAQELGLAGWVRNQPDGTVEAVVEGDAGKLTVMREWLHSGSPQSEVVSLDINEEEPCGEAGFTIRY